MATTHLFSPSLDTLTMGLPMVYHSLCLKRPPPRRLHASLSLLLLSAFRSQCSSFHAHPKHTALLLLPSLCLAIPSGSCTHLGFVTSFFSLCIFCPQKAKCLKTTAITHSAQLYMVSADGSACRCYVFKDSY